MGLEDPIANWLEFNVGISLIDTKAYDISHSELGKYVLSPNNPENILRCMQYIGSKSENGLSENSAGIPIDVVGDALSVGKALDSIAAAYEAALHI